MYNDRKYIHIYTYIQYTYSSWEGSGDDDATCMIFVHPKMAQRV